VLMSPGMGDGIQAAKAGILEVADVFCVNKADRDGADQVIRDLKYMISLGRREHVGPSWRPPIVRTVASRGEGIDELVQAIESHREWMTGHGELERRRDNRASAEIEAIAVARLRSEMGDLHGGDALEQFAKRVVAGDLDPYAAADELIAGLKRKSR
ncbi:MAG: methylmalonyl Co-A mutase-associated GTPase MeaB, partial [Sciscionella sp.]